MKHVLSTLTVLAMSVSILSCSSSGTSPEPPEPDPGSGWGKIYKDDGDFVIEGLGSSQGIKDTSLAWDTADNRACGDVADKLSSIYMELTEDYRRNISNYIDENTGEQFIESAQKTYVFEQLSGCQIVDRQFDTDSDVYWSYAKYNTGIAGVINNFKDKMTSETKKRIEQNAEEALNELDRTTERYLKEKIPTPGEANRNDDE